MNERAAWGSRLGFILAAVGSAVGLGNLWRFPYITATSGGAAFVVVYVFLLLLIGVPALLAELLLGREASRTPLQAYRFGARWGGWLGPVVTFTSVLFLAYYSVISGWVLNLLVHAVTGTPADGMGAVYTDIVEGPDALVAHAIVMGVAVLVVAGGVQKGLERAATIMMPFLGVFLLGLAIWSQTLDGSAAGRAFYLSPDLDAVFSLDTLVAAGGQMFFSIGLGLGTMVAYASYLSKDEPLLGNGGIISISDLLVALVAGLAVFPLVFGLGIENAVLANPDDAIGILFVSIPAGFATLGGWTSAVLVVLFFLALAVAAFTSVISILEVVVGGVEDRWGVSRRKAALLGGLLIYGFGILPALNGGGLTAMDRLVSNVLLPLGALGGVVVVSFGLDRAAERALGDRPRLVAPLRTMWRFVVVPSLAALFVLGVMDLF